MRSHPNPGARRAGMWAAIPLLLVPALSGSLPRATLAGETVSEFTPSSPPLGLRDFTVKAPAGKWKVQFGDGSQSVLLTGGGPELWKVLTVGDYKADVIIGAGAYQVRAFGAHLPVDSAAFRYLRMAHREIVWDYRRSGSLPDGPAAFGMSRLANRDVYSVGFRFAGKPPLRVIKVAIIPDDFLVSHRLYSLEMFARGRELWPEGIPLLLAQMIESIQPRQPEPIGSDPEHRFLLACARGDTAVMHELIDAGARVDLVLEHGTPLTMAGANGQAGAMTLLLASQAATTVEFPASGMTALQFAAGSGSREAVRLLLDRGAELEHRDNDDWTAVHYAALSPDPGALQELLARGAQPDPRATDGISPLMLAARNGQTGTGRLLIEAGADVNATNKDGVTPLQMAAFFGDPELLSALIDRGADISRTLSSKATALHLAAQQGSLECARRLVAAGADPRAARQDGATPIKIARALNDRAMVEVLEQAPKR